MTACTIIARNYLAHARVLHQSFAAQHPDRRFATLVIDGRPRDRALTGIGEVLLLEDLKLPESEVSDMAAIYDVMELATALKPALLMRLLADGGPVMYLDPDIAVYAPLTDAFALAERAGIVLTPHVLQPLPRDGAETSERTIMHAGIFNLGFVGVGDTGWPFLRWWHERLLRDAVVDLANALFTDQRWMDWVPALFDHAVLRDSGYNAAYWNLHERPLRRDVSGALLAGGRPLRFFHFSGWDPQRPWTLSKHTGTRGRVTMADAELAALCAEYSRALADAGLTEARRTPYGLGTTTDGVRLVPEIRRYLRGELARSAAAGSATPPNPYLEPATFTRWLTETVTAEGIPPVTRLAHAVWSARPDLQSAFPRPLTDQAQGFGDWFAADRWAVDRTAEVLADCPRPPAVPSGRPSARTPGWNLVAYANAELGVGEAGRRLARAVMHIGMPAQLVPVAVEKSRQLHIPEHRLAPGLAHANTITCANADQLENIWARAGVGGRGEGRQIGLWFWEVNRVPDAWRTTMEKLDEVWVTSEFTKKAFDRAGGCPVRVIPLPVLAPSRPTSMTRAMLGMPEGKTVFLCPYDFLSVLRRKNPLDVITAYRKAFGPDEGVTLLLKSINGHHAQTDLAQVRHAAAGRPDILVRDGYVDATSMRAMVELADCVVSLHRSEGYGLNLVDAMSLGRPVIATGYSGNLAFMDDESAFLVPASEVEVGDGAPPYDPAAVWAQPDIDAAADLMRVIVDDPARAAAVAGRGQRKVLAEFDVNAVAAVLRPLLVETVWEGLS